MTNPISSPDAAANANIISPISSGSNSFRLINEETDSLGMAHRRYQQLLNGLPVEGAIAIEHFRNGQLQSVSGEWVHQLPTGLLKSAALSEDRALASALKHLGSSSYKWQFPEEEAFLKSETGNPNATFRPHGDLLYYAGNGNLNASGPRLAFRFDIYSQEPLSRQLVYVDALSGKILGSNSLLHEANTTGSANTGYSSEQSITTDQISNTSYRLREGADLLVGKSNKKIETYNLKTGTRYGNAVDFTDSDNQWGYGDAYTTTTPKDIYALDAHFGAQKTYDFYKEVFQRNSIDNNGLTLKSYVHYSKNYFNAFWDGSRMTYGDGSSTNGYLPLTSLDVCGHEITHGLTSYTAKLNYSYESGALNEGFSDILGTSIEAYARGRRGIGSNSSGWNWTLGDDFNYTIRDMSNPGSYSNPDTYKGAYWYNGTADNGGVHTNSGVLNYWFALLTEGSGTGLEHGTLNIDGNIDTNDYGYKFDVLGLGLDKSQAVAYRTLTTYLSPTSQYIDARRWSLQAAADLVGTTVGGSRFTEQDAGEVAYGWNAVGVGGGASSSYIPQFLGTAVADTLYGGHLADVISGNGGMDQLWGNRGSDTFVLADSATEYYVGPNEYALIKDFSISDGDKLQLRAGNKYTYQTNSTTGDTSIFLGDSTGDLLAILSGAKLGDGTFTATSDIWTPGSGGGNPPSSTATLTLSGDHANGSMDEGSTVSVAIQTDGLSNGAEIFWVLSGSGITPNDFTDPTSLTGSLSVDADGKASLNLTAKDDATTEGEESLLVSVFSDNSQSQKLAELSLLIQDTSQAPPATNLTLWGTNGNDSITGYSGDDQIAGVSDPSIDPTDLGQGQIDTLTGREGLDRFLLADSRGVFYNDGSSRSSGTSDYALITDFNEGADLLQLRKGYQYLYRYSGGNTEIFLGNGDRKFNASDELIARLQGIDLTPGPGAYILDQSTSWIALI